MWTRKLLKDNAKRVLSRTYKGTFTVVLVYTAILLIPTVLRLFISPTSPNAYGLQTFISLLSIFFSILVAIPLQVGLMRYLMEARVGNPPLSSLFSVFTSDGFWSVVWTSLKTQIKIALYFLLLIVPGIIKAYEYAMVPYLLAENPYLSSTRAQEISSDMMDGEKWSLFILEWSFFGWYFLASIVVSVLCILFSFLPFILAQWLIIITAMLDVCFISPYVCATIAELYAALREKVLATHCTSTDELGGFEVY